jgi:hypothetical protein
METSAHRALAALQNSVSQYIETGVALLSTDYTDNKQPCLLKAHGQRKLLRQTARELRRPYIEVARSQWRAWKYDPTTGRHKRAKEITRRLEIRADRRYGGDDLVGMLLIGAEEHKWDANPAPVTYKKMKTAWRFYFHGPIGKKACDSFMRACTTDPKFRAVLAPK